MRPRARRLANTRASALLRAEYSPRVSTWLDHSHLAEEGKVTNWKRQYRLRHNWSNGSCRVTEVEFLEPPCPHVLVKLCAGTVFTADAAYGLRAWAAKDPTSCLSSISFSEDSKVSTTRPTSLAVTQLSDEQEIVVGFENGHFNRYIYDVKTCRLGLRSSHVGFRNGAITAMALSSPYLLMVSQHKILSLYNLRTWSTGKAQGTLGPCEIASLQAENMVAPMTLSLRVSTLEIVATIVYSFYHIGCGWSLGIQELRFNKDGQQLESRLTTTVDSQYGIRPLQSLPTNKRQHSATIDSIHSSVTPTEPSILHQQPPTSMSYSHPYLLTSHADNTLTMYLLVSNSNSLFVRGGRRLWGHTSSVSTVQVTNRGKAVSVSSLGNEIRIWELETTVPFLGSRRPLKEESSIQVSPDNRQLGNRLGAKSIPQEIGELDLVPSTHSCMHECVGFDEERVLLLRKKTVGTQLLECYDFT